LLIVRQSGFARNMTSGDGATFFHNGS
jgi:hypothetical protein